MERESGALSVEGAGVQKRYNLPSKLLALIVELKQAINYLAPVQVSLGAQSGSEILLFWQSLVSPDGVPFWLLE